MEPRYRHLNNPLAAGKKNDPASADLRCACRQVLIDTERWEKHHHAPLRLLNFTVVPIGGVSS